MLLYVNRKNYKNIASTDFLDVNSFELTYEGN